jgi:hypothetical protein
MLRYDYDCQSGGNRSMVLWLSLNGFAVQCASASLVAHPHPLFQPPLLKWVRQGERC